MKISILILFAFLISCNSPEKKIKDSLFFQRGTRGNARVEIYDTLYSDMINENMEFFERRTKFLRNSIKMADEYRDSIVLLQYPKPKQDSLLRIGFKWRRERQKDLDNLTFKQSFNDYLYHEMNDTIAGYYARIITKQDTMDFIVNPSFQIVCPKYMYENK